MRNPAARTDRLLAHAPWAILCAMVLAVTAWVPPRNLPLRACTFLRVTGVPCPLCGTTRAFHAAGNGLGREALVLSPLGTLFYAATWAALLFHTAALLDRRRWSLQLLPAGRAARGWLAGGAGGLILVNWAYRLATGQL
jgi:hypothetical protein